ncbi:MAG TPA: hypothetical protein VMR54_13255 [Thermoanaerobaculia bacterium]|nr:hypothetical protein [Thermoanaerobaculia bacterium]
MFPDLTARVLRAAARIARGRATPFYLFDRRQLRTQARAWRRAARLVGSCELYYPYKCNRADPVLRLLANEGVGAEVTFHSDFRLARSRRVPPRRIVIQGPAKSPELIDAGLAARALFVADAREDAMEILTRAGAVSRRPSYLLRLRPSAASPEQRAFGLPVGELLALAREIVARRLPVPEGIAFHLGTGIASMAPYRRALGETARAARELARLGIPTSCVDLGGGFAARSESRLNARGAPRPSGKPPNVIVSELAREARRLLSTPVRLLFEPGRALVSDCLHLVTRVIRVRERRPRDTVYLDASRLAHAFFVARGRHPVASLPRRRGRARTVTLAGPLGVGLDVFWPAIELAPLRAGDLVIIGSVGAYNANAASAWAGDPPAISELI